jgi:hypothetical protein
LYENLPDSLINLSKHNEFANGQKYQAEANNLFDLHKPVDKTIELLVELLPYKIGSVCLGDMFGGNLGHCTHRYTCETAIAKSDCILMEMEIDIFK